MKKKLLFLLPFLLVSLAACDLNGANNDKDDDSEEGASGETFNQDKKEVANALKTYGQTTGFDITAETKSHSIEDGEEYNSQSEIEVAMKGNMVWLISSGSYTGVRLNDNNTITAFASEDGTSFDTNDLAEGQLNGQTPEEFFDDYMETLTSWFYFATTYSSLGLKKVKDFTYVGRSATEYSMKMSFGGEGISISTYVDKELGITLYWLSEDTSLTEGNSSEEFKVTSFKSGNEVTAPNLQ